MNPVDSAAGSQYRKLLFGRLLLVAVLAIFSFQSVPPLSAGPIILRPEQILLLLLLPLVLLRQRLRLMPAPLEPGRVIFYLILLLGMWTVLSNTVFRVPVYENVRELKNGLLFFVLAYYLVYSSVGSTRDITRLLDAATLGTVAALVLFLRGLDFSQDVVRQQGSRAFAEEFLVSYVWLGFSAGLVVLVSILHLRQRRGSALLWVAVGAFAAFCVVASGTRAVAVGVPLSLLSAEVLRMAPRRLLNAGVCLFIAAPLSLCLVPGDIAHCLELSSTATSRSVEESVLRLVDPQAWINAIGTRLENWDMMLAHRSSALVVLTGRDWQPAMDRMVALAHPHNIFIWFYLMGGILSVCLFTFMMGHLLRYLALSARTAAGPDHFLHGTLLALNILALLILLLNAWANAMPAVFGILVGLSHRVIVLHATGHQKVIGATSSSLEMR